MEKFKAMSTPKEKANKMVKMFMPFTRQYDNTRGWVDCIDDAKECALIAVDEILKVAPIDKYENLDSQFSVEYVGQHLFEEYWEEVKAEIEKL